ncbi:dTDP-4-dehydrorhamnose 3,5-epimerase family protein [Candidatus Woesebacteria bacterium]|nr:MAG: dTDP-4-dehydrorhamnose 3,5-epimerase family protein [Candidatus Woesebacteria bacterium]
MGVKFKAVQWNHSVSKPRVIRAIHTENWKKIVYPLTGKTFVAIADVREDSPDFGKVETFIFDCTKENPVRSALLLPPGIGNSICALGSKEVNYMYLVEEYWDNSKASGIAWNDPDLNISWPVKNPIISDRDRANPTLREQFPNKFT